VSASTAVIDPGMAAIAVAFVGAGVSVGVALYGSFRQANLARIQRRHDHRATIYVEVLVALDRLATRVARTDPPVVIGEAKEPPPPLPDEEEWLLNAKVAAFGSPAVKALLATFNEKQRDFFRAVEANRLLTTPQRLTKSSGELMALHDEQEAARRQVYEAISAIKVRVFEELDQ
jgi:hypothetical protein